MAWKVNELIRVASVPNHRPPIHKLALREFRCSSKDDVTLVAVRQAKPPGVCQALTHACHAQSG